MAHVHGGPALVAKKTAFTNIHSDALGQVNCNESMIMRDRGRVPLAVELNDDSAVILYGQPPLEDDAMAEDAIESNAADGTGDDSAEVEDSVSGASRRL